MKRSLARLAVAGLATALGAGSAFAAFPTSVVSSAWVMRANNQISIALNITSQGTLGDCPQITGTLTPLGSGASSVLGWYCPATGQISFLRNSLPAGVTTQIYTGQVITYSQNPTTLEMEGTFVGFGGANGAFPFNAGNAVFINPP